MILHSVTPVVAMQQMLALQDHTLPPVQALALGPYCSAEGTVENGQLTIGRILSTNPQDFLNPALFPGMQLPFLANTRSQ